MSHFTLTAQDLRSGMPLWMGAGGWTPVAADALILDRAGAETCLAAAPLRDVIAAEIVPIRPGPAGPEAPDRRGRIRAHGPTIALPR